MEEIKENSNEKKTTEFLKIRNVVFLTAGKFHNALKNGHLKISNLDMIIFDECHHTTENHPYNYIMQYYYEEKYKIVGSKVPKILGLTASVGIGRVKDAAKHLIKLCANLDCDKVSSLRRQEDLIDLKVIISY